VSEVKGPGVGDNGRKGGSTIDGVLELIHLSKVLFVAEASPHMCLNNGRGLNHLGAGVVKGLLLFLLFLILLPGNTLHGNGCLQGMGHEFRGARPGDLRLALKGKVAGKGGAGAKGVENLKGIVELLELLDGLRVQSTLLGLFLLLLLLLDNIRLGARGALPTHTGQRPQGHGVMLLFDFDSSQGSQVPCRQLTDPGRLLTLLSGLSSGILLLNPRLCGKEKKKKMKNRK